MTRKKVRMIMEGLERESENDGGRRREGKREGFRKKKSLYLEWSTQGMRREKGRGRI